ncbi:M20 family metallopeptidase [Alisedimentitalea sp. MJ-SS2]|uniref:M20 family metallopeptidase n=1 Tax=Aliisedimentitalea sp. MJ-SS2 TaxID=3049795 RepID=UPI002910DCC9|nr:M20 family metallopeptidase [Alisedimentitalea sp. MJ-SS2]MDU8925949.1 M20 family metallopeptidase [Alisedimentitalea sp. MJ-SS2]
MTERAEVIRAAQTLADDARFETDLAGLVCRPTESQNPARRDEMQSYLENLLVPRLMASGFACEIHPNPFGNPFLVARRVEGPDLPTVLGYGHGDVTRGQEGLWSDGRKPFEMCREGDRLYGRGTADNKGQLLINLLALDCVLAQRGRLGFNAIWLIEMGEETGSPGLAEFCAANKALLAADVLIASDGPRMTPETPLVFLGARGAINFRLEVDLREGAHHSGNWGGLLADPAVILAQALATITDRRGQIRVREWRPTSLTPEIREVIAKLPVPVGPEVDPDWGESSLTPQERVYGWNSFAVLTMESGVPAAPVNAISGRASATCQLRFVTGTDAEDIMPALRRHLDAEGFEQVRVVQEEHGYFPATRSDPDNSWVRRVVASLEHTMGVAPHLAPNLGGSLPNHVFMDILGLPTVWIPHSYGGCNQHAPDEHLLLSVVYQALGIMAGLYWDLGEAEITCLADL